MMKRSTATILGAALLGTAMLPLGAGCKPKTEPGAGAPQGTATAGSADETAAGNSDESDAKSKNHRQVNLPKEPFFTEFAYPGGTAVEVLTLGNATSVWFKTPDDITKVAEFYKKKYASGNNHVEAERAYFTQPKTENSGGHGATVTKQPDGSTQIILKLER